MKILYELSVLKVVFYMKFRILKIISLSKFNYFFFLYHCRVMLPLWYDPSESIIQDENQHLV